jgi:hypothetical protein
MNIRPRPGKLARDLNNLSIPQLRPVSQGGDARARALTSRGLGTAEEQPGYAMCELSRSHRRP